MRCQLFDLFGGFCHIDRRLGNPLVAIEMPSLDAADAGALGLQPRTLGPGMA
jgi:hypothetical protein